MLKIVLKMKVTRLYLDYYVAFIDKKRLLAHNSE